MLDRVERVSTAIGRADDARGRAAAHPSEIGREGWKDILWRVWNAFNADRVMLVAAGATFYLLLALFPALTVLVSTYGLVADPVSIVGQLQVLGGLLPQAGIEVIRAQLESLVTQDPATLSFGFIFGFLLALWSANNGIKTLFEAMNIAYEEREKRSFIKLNLVAFVFTLGAMLVAIAFVFAVGILPALIAFVGLDGKTEIIISLVRWPILFVIAALAVSLLYRYGPSREWARWRWIRWGSIATTLLWLLTSIIFSWYLANFANYNATYGSLGAVIGFMMWTWVSMIILVMGAEFDAEVEHQTLRDSTTGREVPMGQRGATMADTKGQCRPSSPEEDLHIAEEGETRGIPSGGSHRNSASRTGRALSFVGPIAAFAIGWLWSKRGRTPRDTFRPTMPRQR